MREVAKEFTCMLRFKDIRLYAIGKNDNNNLDKALEKM